MTLGSNSDGFLGALKQLCQNDEICDKTCSKFISRNILQEKDIQSLLDVLASLLLSQNQTLAVAYYLHDSLPKILARALSNDGFETSFMSNIRADLLHEKRCVALGKLLSVHPDVITFAMKYFMDHPSPFQPSECKETHDEPLAKKRKFSLSPFMLPINDEDIALCCYSFLKMKTDHFRELWNWSQFMKRFLNHERPFIRWLACHCCALVLKMGNHSKDTLLNFKLSPDEIMECSVKHHSDETHRREKFGKISFAGSSSSTDCSLPYSKGETVTSIAGITLPLSSKASSDFKSNLVLVDSTQANLRAIALGIATGKTLCLQGPVGCGKTALVEYLAKMTGRASPPYFFSVQLGDQTDSKTLLGTYQCTDIPGEFVWKPGVLTQAVVGGCWLLLEDIDSCTTDVAAILASLLETRSLSVPGYKDCVHAAPGFQMFLTQRLIPSATGLHRLNTGVTSMLQKHWLTVQMEPLSQTELVEVVKVLYPSLSTVATRMIEVFLLFSAGSHLSALVTNEETSHHQSTKIRIQTAGARLPSTRDLIKWCNRANEAFDVSSLESGLKLFQDAIDIFCCNVSNPATRLELTKSIASKLGIIHTKAEYFCNVHKPVVSSTSSHITTGRITLIRKQTDSALLRVAPRSNFCFTRPAAALLERIACCITHNEPVLLVGETGVGKTSSIQYLAQHMGQSLSVINMNQQSDSADLLGGYKPVELKIVIAPLRDEFETLFRDFFSVDINAKFLSHVAHCFSKKMWTTLLSLMKEITKKALKRFDDHQATTSSQDSKPSKIYTAARKKKWLQLSVKLHKVDEQLKKSHNALAFKFIEGSLVKALQEGHWILLDEINLASAQTLECLSSLLEGSLGSFYLLERGDNESISRHPDFRIFAAMNPATDVGKKELPPGIRNRFTEFFVDELTDRQDLMLLCSSYLAPLALPASKLDALVRFYLTVCQEAVARLCDGTGHKPHYSLRTLCRALSVAAINPCGSVPRSLYEGFLLSFLTQLDRSSHPIVEEMVAKAVTRKSSSDPKSLVKQPIPSPIVPGKVFIQVLGYWINQGPLEPITPDKYILTKTVQRNLGDMVRVVSLARLPVLLQGETSVGKTSLITYLAQLTGNRCLRINNHEHTDLQEYIGCYAADERGNLVFREGVLVEAMRYGHWVILDELNLAPSDVLEALNRVLDDNRELFIPETQKVVKAHPNFMLFATQNPPGLYGGRKVLSRAFRNRFIELHFDEIPSLELETIMHLRCDMPPSYCKKMVAVMTDLQMRRKGSAAFAGKQGFITLRDLFRWGERYRLAQTQIQPGKFYDWDQHIADEGYLVLAGRVRKEEECKIIQESLLKHIKRTVNPDRLFTLNAETSPVTRPILESIVQQTPPGFQHIVWTFNVRRLAVLLGKACEFKEPILLVGETGCGKTTLCQVLAASKTKDLVTINCHMHSESSDFLGGLRPVREHSEENKGKLFEWVDGPLIEAMQNGSVFLADEISLADDSVLERLNSLLEPERKLLLAEKGSSLSGEPCEVTAQGSFIFVGTMNPGGDYGKKELSPALRNRFTEIWCSSCADRSDLMAVIDHNLRSELVFEKAVNKSSSVSSALVDFLEWFSKTDLGNRFSRSLRDVMTWVEFINVCTESSGLDLGDAYIHGACLTFLDSLGTGLTSFATREAVLSFRIAALEYLRRQVIALGTEPARLQSFLSSESNDYEITSTEEKFGIKPFYISRGCTSVMTDPDFLLSAPTTRINAMRVLRGLQLGKALLLEGSPGVGKTSLVAALARAAGHKLTRINLSDQTDISDLFGADLPAEGGKGGQFEWRDGPFLQALKSGHWILLDELNLASQSVLEGLNAVLDHRGDLFIPELGRTFHIQPGRTRLFACQNPLNQGGARKGLPQSFLNRFTQVYMDTLTSQDLEFICSELYPSLPINLIKSMVTFNQLVASETTPGGNWGQRGAPWEMNLRDLSRWCEVTVWGTSNGVLNPGRFVQLIYVDRMRTSRDKDEMMARYNQIFHMEYHLSSDVPQIYVTPSTLYVGDVTLARGNFGAVQGPKLVLRHQLPVLQSLARCVSLGWLSILVGPSGCGKTSSVHLLAQLAGVELRTLVVNSAMDTTEILGGFEQADYKRHLDELAVKVQQVMTQCSQILILQNEKEANYLLSLWEGFLHLDNKESKESKDGAQTVEFELTKFSHKIEALESIIDAVSNVVQTIENKEVLQCLREKLTYLKENSLSDSSLNAGGKFEWVDSILIKSLMDGCWLLVDNVNLCSAAVLDRLNGLLEPQGVLTVSERGVDSHGELITIRPHPDFRLFLAMDPKYGEISRAMRNRGVEIYVTSSEGDVMTSLSQLDQAALLQDIGVSNQHDQQLLLSTHHSMSNMIQGPDPPGLTELLHASYLFVQQMHRGMPPISSLLSSFTKVYIQSRLCDSIETKRQNLSILEESIRNDFEFNISKSLNKLVPNTTIITSEVNSDSYLATVKQRGAVLSALADAEEYELPTVCAFLGIDGVKVDFKMMLTHLVLMFYQTCSTSDVTLGRSWLKSVVTHSRHEEVILELSEALHSALVKVGDLANSSLMWDRRWLPDVLSSIVVQSEVNDQGLENRVALLLYITAINLCTEKSLNRDTLFKHRKVSILEYSHAVSKGTLSDTSSSETIFVEIGPFVDMAHGILRNALSSVGVLVSDEQWWQIRNAFHWIQRLRNQAASLHLSSDKNAEAECLNLLAVHYRWFLKHSFPLVAHLGNDACLNLTPFTEAVTRISASVISNNSVLWHIAKKLRKEMGQPLPISSDRQAQLIAKALHLGSILNVWCKEEKQNSLAAKAHFLLTCEGLEAKAALTVAVRDILIGANLDKVEDRLQQVEGMCSKGSELTQTTVKGECLQFNEEKNLQTLLWPFQETICLHAGNTLLVELLQNKSDASYVFDNPVLTQAMRNIPSIPAAMIGFFEALQMETARLDLFQGMSWLFQFSSQSLAVTNLNNWVPCDLKHVYDVEDVEEYLAQHCPILSRLAVNLLFNHDSSSKEHLFLSSLERHSDYATLFISLRTLLWRNSEYLCNPQYTYRVNEIKSAVAAAKYFLNNLERSCGMSSTQLLTHQDRVSSIIEYFQSHLGKRSSMLTEFNAMLRDLGNVLNNLEKSSSLENETLMKIGLLWTLLGCLESQLFSAFPQIDPMSKNAIKLVYINEEIQSIDVELQAAKMYGSVRGSKKNCMPSHPLLVILENHKTDLELQLSTLCQQVAVRPNPPMYFALTKEMHHFASSLGSASVITNLSRRLLSITSNPSSPEAQIILKEAQTWLHSQRSFRSMLEKRFGLWYPDVVCPLLASSAKLSRGIELMVGIGKKTSLYGLNGPLGITLGKLICSWGNYPSLSSEQPTIMDLLSNLVDKDCSSVIEQALHTLTGMEASELSGQSQMEAFWLLKSAALELKNFICVSQTCQSNEWNAFIKVLQSFMSLWQRQETERREREQDNERLFKSSGAVRCQTISEEAEDHSEIAQLFPSMRENDFGDLEPSNSLDDSPPVKSDVPDSSMLRVMLSDEDMTLLSSLHISLVIAYTKSTWMDRFSSHPNTVSPDYLTPWLQRCAVAARLLTSCRSVLDDYVDRSLLPSWTLACYLASHESGIAGLVSNGNPGDPGFDFYRTPCVSEVKQSKPLLDGLLKRVNQLLDEWPEHPTLNQIVTVINRINGFSTASPISRYLTGLEILLTKMREWEENAHAGVSLAIQSKAVTNLIIQWRRLELACWKGCLNAAALRMQSKASKWWFYVFSLVEAQMRCGDSEEGGIPIKDLVSTLERFIEEAPLGEFETRINILLAFHCHVINLPSTDKQRELLYVLWNLYGFYSQFKDVITKRIVDLKSPIEKKLKDYVKIVRWNDINYWAVKETVFKTQRTLHKHVKEFEKVLKQPARSVLLSSSILGKTQLYPKFSQLNPQKYLVKNDIKIFVGEMTEHDISGDAVPHVLRAGQLFTRSKKLTKEIILLSSCPNLIVSLDKFAGDIAESVQQLATLEIDRSIPKSKQISQAKNQLQMKRKALSDLFRMLQRIGLSHRAGLTYEEDLLKHDFTQLPALDVFVLIKSLNEATQSALSSADNEMISAWEGCSTYLMRSWARYVQLILAVRHPHKDHGPQNLERLRGFPAHLLALVQNNHREVHENTSTLAQMRLHLHKLGSLQHFLCNPLPSQPVLQEWNQRLKSLLVSAKVTLQQFRLLLNSCPEETESSERSITLMPNDVGSLISKDMHWQKGVETVDQILSLIDQCQKSVCVAPCSFSCGQEEFINVDHFQKMSDCFKQFLAIADDLSNLQRLFAVDVIHPYTRSLNWLKEHMLNECSEFSTVCQSISISSERNTPSFNEIVEDVNDLMHKVLLSIQKIYKSYSSSNEPTSFEAEDREAAVEEINPKEEEEENDLEEKHLSDSILKSLQCDIQNLSVSEILSGIKNLVSNLLAIIAEGSCDMEKCVRLALRSVPLMQQWLLLYQFLVQQQVAAHRASSKLLSILLAVFGDVTTKGFCMPEELLSGEEAGDGEVQTDANQEGSMGLGDGEGEKDVSDRIQSEDQLEDARPAGEEKKDEDKECKEDDNGIEMSDNFDAMHQDVNPKEDEEENEDDENDGEKEMGDTEKDANNLDQQIWGSDSEDNNSDDEADEKDEEQGQSGEKIGDKEVGARENEVDKDSKTDDNSPDDGEEKKQEDSKPEINEMKEPDVDDDQINPYHGNQPPEVEPDPMELPDDLQLDEGDAKENDETEENNPFDIDEMKEQVPPEVQQQDTKKETEEGAEQEQSEGEGTDDDETVDPDNENKETLDVSEEENNDNPENSDERKNGKKLDDVEEENDLPKEEENHDQEERQPSKDDPTSESTQRSEDINHHGSMDQVASTPQETQEISGEEAQEEAEGDPGADDKDAVGQAPSNQEMKGHHSDRSGKRPQRDQQKQQSDEEEKRQRPGHSDSQRSLGDINEPVKKRLKTVDTKQPEDEEKAPSDDEVLDSENTADLYQHIKDMKEKSKMQTLDAATEEQAELQPVAINDDDEQAPLDDELMDIDNVEAPLEDTESEQKQKEETVGKDKKDKQRKDQGKLSSQNKLEDSEKNIEIDGERIETLGACRGPDTTFHTRYEELVLPSFVSITDIQEQCEAVRKDLQNQLSGLNQHQMGMEAWQSLTSITNSLARDLSEQLRLVLEPTQATRMKGDFRTGRRINMRKVIPYIASQFRKDKIWMRRTKPSKREYQILLAIDDSSSMADNRSKELAFESLALVSQALTLLEVGELGILSFGEVIKMLHKLGEPFTQHSGARLLQQFSFEQRKTQIGVLVDYATALFMTSKVQTSAQHAQLLVVISDGRGVFSEGQDKVCDCVRKARLSGIFMVFVIIDNPENKDSILDIRTPIFSGGKLLGISSYMDSFPFPFYLILRDISNLPAVLSDALRQWFELVSNVE